MTFRLSALAAAAFALALPAQAAHLVWSYDPQPNIKTCTQNAMRAAKAYGITKITRSGDNLTGILDPDIVVSILCLAAPKGATMVLHVSADPDVPYREADEVRQEIRGLILSGGR